MFSLWQISRLNASIASVYEQGHVASRAAEEVRAEVLRASRAQKMLLTATTAKERDDLGAEVGAGLASSIGQSARGGSRRNSAASPRTRRRSPPTSRAAT
ncbi:hypothetical protein NLY09_06300 (plasmid) [Burkholderia vietnamiensis]